MKKLLFAVIACALFLFSCETSSGEKEKSVPVMTALDSLRMKLNAIVDSSGIKTGMAFLNPETNDTLSVNGNKQFTLMSVVKLAQAFVVLKKVDEGKFQLDQQLHFAKADIRRNTHSPMLKAFPDQDEFDLSIRETIRYAVSESDNNACDRLFKLVSPKEVTAYLHQIGITEIEIATDYANMKEDSIFVNHCSPFAMVDLLKLIHGRKILSASSTDYLLKILTETNNPADRIKGRLPEGTVVAHKTGTMSTDSTGLCPAFNDAGIVYLPDGKPFFIAVFLSDSKAAPEKNAEHIALLTKTVWDFYSKKK